MIRDGKYFLAVRTVVCYDKNAHKNLRNSFFKLQKKSLNSRDLESF